LLKKSVEVGLVLMTLCYRRRTFYCCTMARVDGDV